MKKIKQIEGREYENKLTEPFTILGGMMGIMSGAALFFYGLFSLQRELFPLSNWYALGAVALGVFFACDWLFGWLRWRGFSKRIPHQQIEKGKQFEQQKDQTLPKPIPENKNWNSGQPNTEITLPKAASSCLKARRPAIL